MDPWGCYFWLPPYYRAKFLPSRLNSYGKKVRDFEGKGNAAKKDTLYIEALNQLAENLRYAKADSIRFYGQKALDLSHELNYRKGIFHARSNLALHELYQGNADEVLKINSRNTAEADLLRYPDIATKIHNDIAQAHFINTAYPEAYKSFKTALKFAVASQNNSEIVRINANLGTLFSLLNDYTEALVFYEAAEDYLDKIPDKHMISATLQYWPSQK